MAAPSSAPTNVNINQADRQIALKWNLLSGATSYAIQRSTDGVNFSALGTSVLPNYTDTTPTVGVFYWYKVAAVNGSGTGPYGTAQQMVAAPNSEMSLYEIRLRAKQSADRVNSKFVTDSEWDSFIGLAMYELYDMLITIFEDYFKAPNAIFTTNGALTQYPLPNGLDSYIGDDGNSFVAKPYYKLLGVDLALNSSQNAWVTMGKYQMISRNKYLYPNSNSTIYGWNNAQYRVMGEKIEFIPVPAGNQRIRLLYAPRLAQLLQDTDLSTIGFSGWLRYVIVRAAIYALNKEESDVSVLAGELMTLKQRIEATAPNRDAGQPDTISDSRSATGFGGQGWEGPMGGF